jgi:sugar lactone lactonase YvrE
MKHDGSNPPGQVRHEARLSSPCMGTSRGDDTRPNWGPYSNEAGNFDTPTYTAGQSFEATIAMNANHQGDAQWQFCSYSEQETEECFRRTVVKDWEEVNCHFNDCGAHAHKHDYPYKETVTIPNSLPSGPGTLRWYWVCKETNEIFTSCIDVNIVGDESPSPAPAPAPAGADCASDTADCSSSKCCADQSKTCYVKDSYWASCRSECIPGVWVEEPPQYQTPWSCDVLGTPGTPTTPATPGNAVVPSAGTPGFGSHIEGVSVDPSGKIYATHYRQSADDTSDGNNDNRNVIGQFDPVTGASSVFFTGELGSVFNGMKWTATGDAVYVADVGQGKVVKVDVSSGTPMGTDFCKDDRFVSLGMPNDLALSKSGYLFLSGQDWGSVTGALWLCTPDGLAMQLEGGMSRTNGIALSPDDTTLYLTEAKGSPVEGAANANGQLIWKYTVAADGQVSDKTLFYNFGTAATPGADVDSDGMRTDIAGNLYVTRNGAGRIDVISPAGVLLKQVSTLSSTLYPTNLAFGGADGKTIFAVGRCGDAGWGTGDGCIEQIGVKADYAGREWAWMHSKIDTSSGGFLDFLSGSRHVSATVSWAIACASVAWFFSAAYE